MAAPMKLVLLRTNSRSMRKIANLATNTSNRQIQQRRLFASSTGENESLESRLRDYEISTEEFKYVERLLPKKYIPEPPSHPTPSGWVPPKESAVELPYFVRRTKNHMMPVYMEQRHGGSQLTTKIHRIDGDIWAFDADLKEYLEEVLQKELKTQVHEIARYVRVKGHHIPHVTQFLLDKGF